MTCGPLGIGLRVWADLGQTVSAECRDTDALAVAIADCVEVESCLDFGRGRRAGPILLICDHEQGRTAEHRVVQHGLQQSMLIEVLEDQKQLILLKD